MKKEIKDTNHDVHKRVFYLTITGEDLCFPEEDMDVHEMVEHIWGFIEDLLVNKRYDVGEIDNIDYDNRIDGKEALWDGYDSPPDSVLRIVIEDDTGRWETKSYGLWDKEDVQDK